MRKLGMYMALFGVLAIVLNFLDRVPTLLAWIYNWGEGVAWGIKIGLVVAGAVLFFMGKPAAEAGGAEAVGAEATGAEASGAEASGAEATGGAEGGAEQ